MREVGFFRKQTLEREAGGEGVLEAYQRRSKGVSKGWLEGDTEGVAIECYKRMRCGVCHWEW